MAGLKVFLPKTVYPLLKDAAAGKPSFRRVGGTVLFCDVAGFTALTEALSVLGREGAEELTRILNAYFTRMITIIEEEGGDVLRFGGDAMAVLFPYDEDGVRSARASLRMMAAMPAFSAMKTRAGTFGLTMKIGASYGDILLGIVGNKDNSRDYYASGPALDFSAEAEHHAEPGMIVCHPSFLKRTSDTIATEPREGAFRTLVKVEGGMRGKIPKNTPPDEALLQKLLPSYLSEYVEAGRIGEHRGTCVLFVSFSGWLKKGIPDAEAHARLERCYEIFFDIASRFGGYVNKLDMGDKGSKAIMTFGVPFALEKREEMAVRAGLETFARGDFPGGVVLRGGLTSGALFSGPVGSPTRREYTVMGNSINLAARFMQNADENQILCDGKCVKAASAALSFETLPPIRVKGFKDEVPVFEPVGEREERSEIKTFIVERKRARGKLEECLLREETRAVAIVGEAGTGKSAMIEWAAERAVASGIPVVRVPLGSYSMERPFGAWRGPFRALIGVEKMDPEEKLRSARDRALAGEQAGYRVLVNQLLDIPEEDSPAIRNLSPKERKALTFAVLERAFAAGGRQAILFDNLHWADPVSIEFLSFILGGDSTSNIRVAFSLRPGNEKVDQLAARCEKIELEPLSTKGIGRFLRDGLNVLDAEKDVLKWFERYSKGIPAVVKALLNAVDAAGLIQDTPAGRRIDRDRLFRTKFPDTLEGLYLAPVDRLPALEKSILGHASVLGTSVSVNLLRILSETEESKLQSALKTLESSGILRADSWGDRPYEIFTDGMLREAVYSTLSFAVRRKDHLKLAEFMEEHGADQPKLWPTLAQHFQEGGDEKRARRYSRLAGRDAFKRYDNVTALRFLETACKKLTTKPEVVEDTFKLIDVYRFLGRQSESKQFLTFLVENQEQVAPAQRLRLQLFIAHERGAYKDLDGTEAALQRGIELATNLGDIDSQGRCYVNLVGLVYGPSGRMKEAEEVLKKALALPKGPNQAVFRTLAAMNLGVVCQLSGRMKEAEAYFVKAYSVAQREGLGPQAAAVAGNLCLFYMKSGNFQKAIIWGSRTVKIQDLFALRSQKVYSRLNYSLALLLKGRIVEAENNLFIVKRNAESVGERAQIAQASKGIAYAIQVRANYIECLQEMNEALSLTIDLRDGLYFNDALVESCAVFYALDSPKMAKELWRRKDVSDTRAECPGTTSQQKPLERVKTWMSGDVKRILDIGWVEIEGLAPEEKMERLLVASETAWSNGNIPIARRRLAAAFRALTHWPEYGAKIRIMRLAALLDPKRFDREKKQEALKLIKRYIGGTWGLRLLCVIADAEKDADEKKRLTRLARRRLGFVRKNSPAWAWEKIAEFPEVQPLLTQKLLKPVSN